jgi:hypothetical protein
MMAPEPYVHQKGRIKGRSVRKPWKRPFIQASAPGHINSVMSKLLKLEDLTLTEHNPPFFKLFTQENLAAF